ncbi:MAG TPA: histidine kinase [Puia sp.]|nr:histidine kinase [Puia sp.]
MEKKYRYSFKKVSLWVLAINTLFGAFTLAVLFYVKQPFQALDMRTFSIPRFIARTMVGAVFQVFFYYLSLNWYYRLLARKAAWKEYLPSVLVLTACCFAFYFVYDVTTKKEEYKVTFDISMKVFSYSLGAFFQLLIPLIIAAVTRQLDEKKWQASNQKILEQRTFQLEKEKMQADYLFLKAQINPHFLHNTLNFLYSRSLPYSPELSEGILTLSEIMRYALDKTEDEDGKVQLSKEIEHVQHFLKIQQLRFGHSLQVVFTIRGNPEGRRILPFVLITLTENAFKHGDLKNADNPIRLELDISEDGRLHFFCSNKKKSGPKELSTGIGLDNTRKRLELAYNENYSLYIKDQRELFTVDLILTL